MSKSQRFTIGAAAVFFALISFGLRAQDQTTSPDQQERANAINAVRRINTAEIIFASGTKDGSVAAHNRFATWDELNGSGALKAVKGQQLSPGSEIMPGWHLDLLVSPDGKSWSIALHDKREGDGLFSVFSDESGIIYLGAPMQ